MRTNRKQELKQRFVRRDTFRVIRSTILSADLAELARPVGQDHRRPFVDQAGISRALGVVESNTTEPAPGKLIVATRIHAKRIDVTHLLTSIAPHQFSAG